jgi:hypothetical protein
MLFVIELHLTKVRKNFHSHFQISGGSHFSALPLKNAR